MPKDTVESKQNVITTDFTRLVGCEAPVQLSAMGGIATPPLIAAVANAGGLGMLGAVQLSPQVLTQFLEQIRATTADGKIGVNFLMPFVDEKGVEIAARHADVVEFFYGEPRVDLIQRVHDGGALAAWQIGSPDEAREAIDAGCNFIVAQGIEAGGHVRGRLPLIVLLDRVLEFADIPVLAAGGVGTGSGLAATLATGAAGVRIGTRFLASTESVAHPEYIDALLRAKASDTVLTSAFNDGWPDAPHRILKSCIKATEQHDTKTVGTIVLGGQTIPIPKFNVVPPDNSATGNIAAMCLYAGQSVETVVKRETAAEIVRSLVNDAEILIRAVAASLTE